MMPNTKFRRNKFNCFVEIAYQTHASELIKNKMYPITNISMLRAIRTAPPIPNKRPMVLRSFRKLIISPSEMRGRKDEYRLV